MPYDLTKACHDLLNGFYQFDSNFINMVDQFRYQHVHKAMKSVGISYNYYMAAKNFFKPGVLNEFAQALLFDWNNFKLNCNI